VSAPTFRILLADAMPSAAVAELGRCAEFEVVERTGLKGSALGDALRDVDAVIVRSSTTITREALRSAERLRVIGRAGVGVDNIDVAAASERGIAVLNAPSGNTDSAAELTLALMLAVARRLPAAAASMRAGEWDRKSFTGIELKGRTLGLVGLGRIGSGVAARARVFGMHVVAFDPAVSEERCAALHVERCHLDALLDCADIVSLHLPLTPATAGLIGARELARLRTGAIIVNAARGGILDEVALFHALESGHLGGAALDVYETEPLPPDHPLRGMQNVVLTPHIGAATAEAQRNVAIEIAAAVRNALLNRDVSGAVNAEAILVPGIPS
jgi:D-3-phosphoglycerate dehydrogenase